MATLEQQLKALEKSPKFQQMVKNAQKTAAKQGKQFGQGTDAPSPGVAHNKAQEMKAILYRYISDVIPSIEESDIQIGIPEIDTDGTYTVDIWFENVYRPSLTGTGGVDNIIRLFSKGYDAGTQVYGMWHGERWASRTHLDSDDFLQRAVEEFNLKNKTAFAELDEQYYG